MDFQLEDSGGHFQNLYVFLHLALLFDRLVNFVFLQKLKMTSLRVDPNEDTRPTRGDVGARLRRTQTPPVRAGEVHFPRNSDVLDKSSIIQELQEELQGEFMVQQ